MKHVEFFDPFPNLPSFERNIMKLRCYEVTLALYYAEEIGRQVLDMIDCHDRAKLRTNPDFVPRAQKGTKRRLEKSIRAMKSDGAITEDEEELILEVRHFRNSLAHEVDYMFLDLEKTQFAGSKPNRDERRALEMPQYDHGAIGRVDEAFGILDRALRQNYRSMTISMRGPWLFSSTETALKREIKLTKSKLRKLAALRKKDLALLNKERNIGFRMLKELSHKEYFSLRFNRGPMTKRGIEFCYRLFDIELSDLAVAHIFEMMLPSITKRRRQWKALGAKRRPAVTFNSIPVQIVRSPYDEKQP